VSVVEATEPAAHAERETDRPLRVLLVGDDEDDFVQTRDLLAEIPGSPFVLEWVPGYAAGREALARQTHDVYLLDYRLGRHSGLDLLAEAVRAGCKAPLILLTGQGEREVDLQAMRAGASDYLVKGAIDAPLLERTIRYALERKRQEESLRRFHAELEERVRERTAALERANAELQAEVAARRQVEEELRESREQLRRRAEQLGVADRRKDDFLAMLAHEMRNPLAPLRNALHILRLAGNNPVVVSQVRDLMERQLTHLIRLVDDLLDVSRITRGKIDLRRERVDLADVVRNAVEISRPQIEAGRHELAVELPHEPLPVDGDPVRLAQVLANLLNNSSKYTPEGGRIGVTVGRQGEEAVVRVRDNGIGIPPERLPHIFEMFAQLDRDQDRTQGGLGIGLTLVRSLVQMHGGTITAHSEGAGRGSEFVVRLPLAPRASAPPPAEASAGRGGAPAAPRRRVLVVEDNVDSARTLGMLLEIMGHEVRVAHDGESALEAAPGFAPQVVLCDIGLPRMDGYEVARRLRGLPGVREAVLVAQTGWGQEEDRRRSESAGFDYHLLKPIDPDALNELLVRVVN
jgi:signal transduction histidine kinase